MKILARLAVGCHDGISRFRSHRSIGQRLIHNLVPSYSHTETLTHPHPRPGEHPVSPAITESRWAMLSTYLRRENSIAHGKTVAESITSTGRGFRISADLVAPPPSSFLCYNWKCSDSGDEKDPDEDPKIVAVHGDSVLIEFMHKLDCWTTTNDYFVYRGGAAASARPPSLSLLPTHDFSKGLQGDPSVQPWHPRDQVLFENTTGLLRRGEDELLVVELDGRNQSDGVGGTAADPNVLRLGSSEWEKRSAVPIVPKDGSRGEMLPKLWNPEKVVPVGDRFLCWVNNYSSGILVCDMADTNLVMIHQFPLPVMPRERRHDGHGCCTDDEDDNDEMQYCRNMCGAGAEASRFVNIDPRCCCGGPGRGTCLHSRFAFTVTTWTMSLGAGVQMTWVKDGVFDCEELWALPGYEGLPRVPPDCPVVSLDNPDVICLKVSNRCLIRSSYKQEKVWILKVDTRRKVMLAVFQCPNDPYDHLPATFLN